MKVAADRKIAIVDIDGTIADVRHRLHHIQGPSKKNWKAFFEGMDRDTPINAVIAQVHELEKEHDLIVVTGRPEHYRARTEKWFKKYAVMPPQLSAALAKGSDIPVDVDPQFDFHPPLR